MRYRTLGMSVLAVVALAVAGLTGAAAQDSSPAAGDEAFAGLTGISEIALTLTDDSLEGVPDETNEGWHVVTFTNAVTPSGDPFEDRWSVEIVLLPEGKTVDDLAAVLEAMMGGDGGPPSETEEGTDDAPPVAGEEDPFAWANQVFQPGGPGAQVGETTQALIYLEPGNYAALIFGPYAPVPMTVVEAGDAETIDVGQAITPDVVITETGTSGSFDFAVETGTFAGGPAVIEVVNDSDQPHFIVGIWSAVPLSEDEVMALLMSDESGTPPPGAPDPSELSHGFITGTQSPGTTQYLALDLEPGYYVLLCFVGDPNQGGVPHSFAGMIEIAPIGV